NIPATAAAHPIPTPIATRTENGCACPPSNQSASQPIGQPITTAAIASAPTVAHTIAMNSTSPPSPFPHIARASRVTRVLIFSVLPRGGPSSPVDQHALRPVVRQRLDVVDL